MLADLSKVDDYGDIKKDKLSLCFKLHTTFKLHTLKILIYIRKILKKKLAEVFKKHRSAAKIILIFGFILLKVKTDEMIYYYAH